MGNTSIKSVRKYCQKTYEQINVFVKKGEKAKLKELAEKEEMSLNHLITVALKEYTENHAYTFMGFNWIEY